MVVEAPLSEERSLAVLAKIAETAPGKPVRYVALDALPLRPQRGAARLHREGRHDRHDAGQPRLRRAAREGEEHDPPDLLAREPQAPVIETFTGKRVFDDGTRTLELLDIGPSPHVTESVIALPAEAEGGLRVRPASRSRSRGRSTPASPALVDFADQLKKRGLVVETIAPGHGRLGTMADLRRRSR